MHKGVADNEYEIESILFDETFGSKTMYLVKWKNYPMDQCTWEPYRNLTNCQDILSEYQSNKIVPKNIYLSNSYKKLYDSLNTHTDLELQEILQKSVDKGGIPLINESCIKGTIAYLSTLPVGSRSVKLLNFVTQNLKIIEAHKRRSKQMERLEKWQTSMSKVCNFNLSVVNSVDFEGPPKKFCYVEECVAGTGVTIPNDPPLWCHCGEKPKEVEETVSKRRRKTGNCHAPEVEMAYNKLKRVVVEPGTPIYECNKKCKCSMDCTNRVVQFGPSKQLKLQIFRTNNNRGWGVKTLIPIKQGTFVSKYSGEVITRSEADERAVTHGSKSTYMFDLDYNTEKNDSLYSVDATYFGNVSHFINHSCDANLAIYAVWIDCLDLNLPTLALFASRNIAVGEEITFNYMTSVNSQKRIKCKCQSENCRGYLC